MILDENIKRDFYTVVQLSENMFFDNDGTLICENAILGKAGTQTYSGKELGLDTAELIIMHRPETEVFDEQSLASLRGKALTQFHPKEDVSVDNYQSLAKGVVLNVKRDGNLIRGDIKVTDKEVIELITSKKMVELSLGYESKLKYHKDNQLIQTQIVYNHVALVPKGRAEIARIVDEQKTRILDKSLQEGVAELDKKENLMSKMLTALGLKRRENTEDGVELYELSLQDTAEDSESESVETVETNDPEETGENIEDNTTNTLNGTVDVEGIDITVVEPNIIEVSEETEETEDEETTENEDSENAETENIEDALTTAEENEDEGEQTMDKLDQLIAKAEKIAKIEDAGLRKTLQDQLLAEFAPVTETEETEPDNSALSDFGKLSFEDSELERYDANAELKKLYDEISPHHPKYEGKYENYIKARKQFDMDCRANTIQDLIEDGLSGGTK